MGSFHCQAMSCSDEGGCQTLPNGQVQMCASSYWQDIDCGSYTCVDNHFIPTAANNVVASASTAATQNPNVDSRASNVVISDTGTTGHWKCLEKPVPTKEENFGTASYHPGGSMASVYAPDSNRFRCNTQPPDSGFYVAVWTRYDASQVSQPMPKNCNQWLTLKNPKTGRTAEALVIDRCASCVGVDRQTSDLTTPDSLVNGATIDLSPALWDELYDGAEYGVYDVEYDGPVFGGSWDGQPDALTSPYCA